MIDRRTLLRAGIGAVGMAVAGGASAAAVATPSAGGWERLRAVLDGDLVLPGDTGYDQAKQLASSVFDGVRPQAIAYCDNTRDVRTCLAYAQDHDVQLTVRSGGHSAAGYSTTTGMVLDVSRLDGIDIGSSTVVLGTGAQGVDVLATLQPTGLATVLGNCPTVCAGGYIQGGGIGPQARKFGVASDRLRSAEVVLADGRVVTCSASHEPELFWALRGGGGGNFGVVTKFEIAPTTAARMVSFTLSFDWAQAAEVVGAVLPWMERAPDDLFANLTALNQDAAPGARPALLVSGGWLGDDPSGLDPLLNELVAAVGSVPLSRSTDDLSFFDAMMRMFGCGTDTVGQCHRVGYSPEAELARQGVVVSRGRLLEAPMTGGAIDRALAAFEADPVAGQFRVMSWGGLGGQINRVAPAATAYVHRSAQHYFNYTAGLRGPAPTAEQEGAVRSWVDGGFAVAREFGGEGQVNFIDPELGEWRRAYYGDNYDRLVRVKRAYDPHGFFRFPQAIGT